MVQDQAFIELMVNFKPWKISVKQLLRDLGNLKYLHQVDWFGCICICSNTYVWFLSFIHLLCVLLMHTGFS